MLCPVWVKIDKKDAPAIGKNIVTQKMSDDMRCSAMLLARPKEFESPAFRLGGGRSILLSYGRICFGRNIFAANWPK